MKAIRLILIILVGGILVYLTYQSKYQTFFFESAIWGVLILAGFVLLIWAFFKDLKSYQLDKQLVSFSTTIVAFLFVIVILTMEYKISKDFNKPTLLKVFYDGDYNGTGIDFKTDGTYIFDNSAIGISVFQYGSYQIIADKIIMDKNEIDNVILTDILEIRKKQIEFSDGKREEKYVYQITKDGQIIDRATEFRVVLDNRH